jgi:peptidoglycan/LPS O-acetylase OafA/YrhL
MMWVILGHTYFYSLATALGNPLVALEFFKSFSFNLITSGAYAVDIFFWLSGFLGVYILLNVTRKKNGKMQNPLLIWLHRFLRIVPLYVITLFFFWFLMSAVGSGPIFFQFWRTRAKYCDTSWWSHLFFLNNFYELSHDANSCMGWTWYLANDFQFFLLIPLLVFLLFKNRTIGLVFVGVLQTVCFIITFIVAWDGNMSPSYFKATDDYSNFYYHRPWARISPFFIGVIAALLLHAFKNDVPEVSRCKRIMDKIDQSKIIRLILYITGDLLVMIMIFIFYFINNYPDSFSKFFNISFLTFSRGLFVLGMNLSVLPVLMGHNSIVRKFLAFDAFTPLARLTFGAYMVHPSYMLFHSLNTRTGEYMTMNAGVERYLTWLVAAFGTSLLITLLVETPFMVLEKTFLMGGGKKKTVKKEEIGDPSEKLLKGDNLINKSEIENGSTFDGGNNNSEFVEGKAFLNIEKNGAASLSINSDEAEDSITEKHLNVKMGKFQSQNFMANNGH